jgi:hypothetical protein
MPGVNPPSLPENYDGQFEMCKRNDTTAFTLSSPAVVD